MARRQTSTVVLKVKYGWQQVALPEVAETWPGNDVAFYEITFTADAGFERLIQLEVGDLPAGATASFTPNPAPVTAVVALGIDTSEVAVGDYTFGIIGTAVAPVEGG